MSFTKISKTNVSKLYNYNNYDEELFEKFVKNNNIVSYSKHPTFVSWDYYLKHGRDVGGTKHNEGLPPHNDHAYAFKTSSKEIYYVYQPYFKADKIREDVENWADKVGISCKVYESNYSWYNREHDTCMVILYAKTTKEPVVEDIN